jgi:hypothetical protein
MDVSFLEPVFSARGPYATVCADVTHTTENADAELELRARAVAARLTEQGAPQAVVEAVRSRLLEGNQGGEIGTWRGRAVVVGADGTVLLDEPLADRPSQEIAEWSPQPDLLPVLRQLPGRVPHVVVLADRIGADITVAALPGKPVQEKSVEAVEDFPVHKARIGGWSELRFLHKVENRWIENVERVADEVDSLVRRLQPAFVLAAGDVRARQILTDRASELTQERLVTMEEGGRAAGADREPVVQRAALLVAEHEARDCARVLEQVQAAAVHGLSVTGTPLVVETMRKNQVETLVLADEPDDERLLVGDDPLELGVRPEEMDAIGALAVHSVPADRALLAAAVATTADVAVVPRSAMPGDIPVAAVLRFTDPATPGGPRV